MNQRLAETDVLILDLQATNSRAEVGTLLEAGWARFRAGDRPESVVVKTRTIRPPENVEIPRPVLRVTGLTREELAEGSDEAGLWEEIETAAEVKPMPCVIHFARYEEGLLHRLSRDYGGGRPFPLRILCTHQLSRRIFPDLPRFGLRAIAGYLGYSAPEPRRSAHHVAATAWIWHRLVTELAARGIVTWDQLEELVADAAPRARGAGKTPLSRPDHLPDRTGVYGMFRSNGDLLYVGKAKSLRKRIPAYFRRRGQPEHILEMLTQARAIRTRTTFTALEAALSECRLIQALNPPYNRALRQPGVPMVFFSADLRSKSEYCDPGHLLGPIPDNGTGELLAEVARLISDPASGIPPASGSVSESPEPDTSGGRGLYRTLFDGVPEPARCAEAVLDWLSRTGVPAGAEAPEIVRRLRRFGRASLRSQGEVTREAAEPSESPEPDLGGSLSPVEDPGAPNSGPATSIAGTAAATSLSPEDLPARRLTALCAAWARMEVRSRWVRRIAGCSVRWRRRAPLWNLVVFEGGRPAFWGFQHAGEELPSRPANGMKRISRSEDLSLRVLTTELRRLAGEGATIEIGLAGGRILRGRRLEVWLKWL